MDTALSEIHRVQNSFRAVMGAMARPGSLETMSVTKDGHTPYPAIHAPLATLMDMLVDQATTFSLDENHYRELIDTVCAETHAKHVSPAEAAFAVVPDTADAFYAESAIARATPGSLASPETGATVLIGCTRLMAHGEQAKPAEEDRVMHWISVEGPGVKTAHVFGVDRVDWVWARNRREDEFPCGIDIILADEEGNVVAIPRTSFISLLAVGGPSEKGGI